MKITRTIDGRSVDIELTEQELSDAYSEVQFMACRDIIQTELVAHLKPTEKITGDEQQHNFILNDLAGQLCNDERESIEYFRSGDLARIVDAAYKRGLIVPKDDRLSLDDRIVRAQEAATQQQCSPRHPDREER